MTALLSIINYTLNMANKTITKENAPQVIAELFEAFAQAKLVPTGKVRGWLESNHRGSVDWAVGDTTDNEVGRYFFHVDIDGEKAGINYREWNEWDETVGQRNMHEPTDADKLHSKIRQVFGRLGYTVATVHTDGYQMHWDHDVSYAITVK